MKESLLIQRIVLFVVGALAAGISPSVIAAEPVLTARDTAIGESHTVTASVDFSTKTVSDKQAVLNVGVFTIPRGYSASSFVYRWNDPAIGAQSNLITASTVYSLSKGRYMTELKDNPNAVLPAGDYRLVVGGTSGATAQLTYLLDIADAIDDSEAAALKRLWFGIVDFRNACVNDGANGWKQFADPLVMQHVDEFNQRIWQNDADVGWSYFFSLAMFDIGRPTTDNPLVGFYHPWSDVWLFTEWQVRPTAKIVGIEMLCGEHVRQRGKLPFDARSDFRVDWLRREGFRVEQLSRAVVGNLREFQQVAYAKASWRDALQLNDRTFESQELNDWVVSLRLSQAWLRAGETALGSEVFDDANPMPPVLGQLISAYGGFLDAGTAGNIGLLIDRAGNTHPATAETIRQLPRNAFERFNPVFWLADDQSAQVYLVPDRNPDYCLALTYAQTTDGLRLDRIDFVHFPSVAKVLLKNGGKG
jgi:hypothetical protein